MGKVQVDVLTNADAAKWDEWVDASPQGTVFHRDAFLRAMAQESGTRLYRLVRGTQGGSPICLLPVFVQRKGPFRIVHSPPSGCAIPYLGPVFLGESTKQSRIESQCREAIIHLCSDIKSRVRPHLVRLISSPTLSDVRPFTWNGFKATPNYTYYLDLEAPLQDIKKAFDKRVRQRIQKADAYPDLKLSKKLNGTAPEFYGNLEARYREQGYHIPFSQKYLEALSNAQPSVPVAYRGYSKSRQMLTGLLLLQSKEKWTAWVGGARPPKEYDGLVELLHWNNIQEAKAAGAQVYERVGANTPHLCQSKAKYNLRPVPYFELTRGTVLATSAMNLYKHLRRKKKQSSSDGDLS